MSEPDIFRCDVVSADDGRVTLALAGELDSSNAVQLVAAVEDATQREMVVLVVDAARLDFCDAAGLRRFEEAARWCATRGIAFWVEHPQPLVQRLFEVTGLETLFSRADGLPPR